MSWRRRRTEWAARIAATFAGALTGYVAGRLHGRAQEAARDRERALRALAGTKPDWEVRAAEAEAAAVEHARKGSSYEATKAMEIALQIRHAHRDDR